MRDFSNNRGTWWYLKRVFIIMTLAALPLTVPLLGQDNRWPLHLSGERELSLSQSDEADIAAITERLHAVKSLRNMDPDHAIGLYGQIYYDSRALGYKNGMAYALSGIAVCYGYTGKYSQSLRFSRMALYIAELIYDQQLIADIYNNMAGAWQQQGGYEQSILYFYKSLSVLQQLDSASSEMSTARLYTNLGVSWAELGEMDRAIRYLNTAEEKAYIHQDSVLLSFVAVSKSYLYGREKNPALLREYASRAFDLSVRMKEPRVQLTALINLGMSYAMEGKAGEAMTWLRKAARYGRYVKTDEAVMIADFSLGNGYMKTGDYARAEKHLYNALAMAGSLGARRMMLEIYDLLAALYLSHNDYKNAFTWQQHARMLQDSLNRIEKNKSVDMLLHFHTAQKDKAIAEQKLLLSRKEQNIRQKNFWLAGISIGGLMVVTLLYTLYRSNRQKQQLQSTTIRNMQQEAEIAQLRAMMQGEEKERARLAREIHDGVGGILSAARMNFNALQDVDMLLPQTDPYRNGMQLLDEACDELRKTAHNLLPDSLLDEGLVQSVQTYCDKMSRGQQLDISFEHFGDIGRLPQEIEHSLYRIIQELVHNIRKHAQATTALVQFSREDSLLHITVEDNGVGMPEADGGKGGIGLRNLRARVRDLGGVLEIDSRSRVGTTVYITFDIRKFSTGRQLEISEV